MAALPFMAASSASHAGMGVVRLKIVKAGFIIGVGGGSGVLRYAGMITR
jgi:hypothetical protein